MKGISLFCLLCVSISGWAQQKKESYPIPTPSADRMKSFETRKQMEARSLLSQVEFHSAGPAIMSGRVSDVDVNPLDPTIFYVAFASGGLWKTSNNGSTFTTLFDHEACMTIGDIAVDWGHGETIWVGTGESNSSRSSYAGTGIYKSTDLGKTWVNMGLRESHHIGRIIIHPAKPDVLWVAAVGHLYSPNADRGVYKTTDGGNTWKRVLFVDENTGAIDLVIDPVHPDVLYAAMWHRERRAWNFTESGAGSGIFKSTDGGETWLNITDGGNGFPKGDQVGRIGLAISDKNPEIIYACLDNQEKVPSREADDSTKLTVKRLQGMSREEFLKLPVGQVETYLRENDFPSKYTAEKVIQMIKDDKIKPFALADYLEDANARLFNTPVRGAEIYRSNDGGKTWSRTHEKVLEGLYYSYGYYFGQIRIDPRDDNKIYILGVPLLKSSDGGKTFSSIDGDNLHGDHHALWIDPRREGHLVNGNDGGLNISYDDGKTWFKLNNIPVGQFYSVNYDMAQPYNVYGGLQDNGVWTGPSNYVFSTGWQASGQYPYKSLLGGDGMQVEVDTRDNNLVYAGFQFGYYYLVNRATGDTKSIKPKHDIGETPLRFNWQTPIHLSRHNQDILYIGSHRFHRSLNRGELFETFSGDLTKGPKTGDVTYGTITTIFESPLRFGLIYTGTDDGLIHLSFDGGYTWKRISDKLPQNYWISRVAPSGHKEGRVYVSLNGYRWDNFDALVFASEDYGQSWQRIGLDLPGEPVNVVREDPQNPDILYVGTDHGLYASLDRGLHFMKMGKGLPDAPIHDLVIHPRDHDLIIGTHGRSLYIAHARELQQLTTEILAENIHLFPPDKIRFSASWGKNYSIWDSAYIPSIQIALYAKEAGDADIQVMSQGGLTLASFNARLVKGLNYVVYDLSIKADQKEAYIRELEGINKNKVRLPETRYGKLFLYKGNYDLVISAASSKTKDKIIIE